jgi:SAM-dependent methyltransferase
MTATAAQSALQRRLAILACPACRAALELRPDGLACRGCGAAYPRVSVDGVEAVRLAPAAGVPDKGRIQSFWADIYRQWYARDDRALTAEGLGRELDELEDLFRRRRHLAVTEMDLAGLAGRELCEIGSGAGGHSALFRRHGAHVTSVDITEERVFSTARKLGFLESLPGSGLALQADAERLPFRDGAFDVVYSNGVLHHTVDFEAAVREALRILRPGGKLVAMLYSRHSAWFWMKLLPQALLSGLFFRRPEAEWLGWLTEGGPSPGQGRNPLTRVFSARELQRLFAGQGKLSLRKSSFFWWDLPVPYGGKARNALFRLFGRKPHPGGRLVYGRPFFHETAWELGLGTVAGSAWNIVLEKRSAS